MNFGNILRELLEDNDITQKQLADDLNIASTTIGNYIRGLREPDFGITKDHGEDELLHLYRTLPEDKKELLLEQGKLLVRLNLKEDVKSSKSTLQRKNNVG